MIEFTKPSITVNDTNSKKRPEIIAIDGEGVELAPGERQSYILLCASDGSYVENTSGLSSEQCFDFVLDLKARHPRSIIVAFSFGYDFNHFIRHLPVAKLQFLWKSGSCRWHEYRISFCSNKSYYVGLWDKSTKKRLKGCQIYDSWGFFQSSFVKALEDWKIGDPSDIEMIGAMKNQRDSFHVENLDNMRAYCFSECKNLATLVGRVLDETDKADIQLTRYDGAGAVAGAMMRKHKIRDHNTKFPEDVEQKLRCAYYGGRIQTTQLGYFKEVYGNDINSAYPAAMVDLPSLTDMSWYETSSYDANAKYALWYVKWSVPRSTPVTPFPWRDKHGAVLYPAQGEGWYWNVEVSEAMRHFSSRISVLRGIVLQPLDDTALCFDYVREYYRQRQVYKATKDARHIILKLGLNASYGKCAQNKGYRAQRPPYQNFFWAGYITAKTRATILSACMTNPDSVVAIQTDGIWSTEKLDVPLGTELGTFEQTGESHDFLLLQPGIYHSFDKPISKTRGFRKLDINWKDALEQWMRHKLAAKITLSSRRFIGLGISLQWGHLRDWLRWKDISLSFTIFNLKASPLDSDYGLIDSSDNIRVYGPNSVIGESSEYKLKQQWQEFEDSANVFNGSEKDQP